MRTFPHLLALALVAIAGCNGPTLAAYRELCETRADCSGEPICVGTNTGTVCATPCEVDGDCSRHGALAYCDVGSLGCLQMCEAESDCDGDTACMEGFCEAGEAAP